jgi:predicted O-methyltransferase YrrM
MILHCLRFLLGLDEPHTQVTERELSLLREYATGTAVEIGCYEGKTTAALAPHCNTLYTLDPFIRGRLGICYGEVIARRQVERSNLHNVKFVKAYSWDFAARFEKRVDFIFIDGDHSDEGIQRDWHDWYPKVVNGGVIALHDARIAPNSPTELGTHRFVKEINSPIVDAIDSLVILRK